MDTSENYIKMNVKAPEIQRLLPEDDREHCYLVCSQYGWYFHSEGFKGEKITLSDCGCIAPSVWLPRQDQLQEMIMPKDRPVAYLLNAFLIFCGDLPLTICNVFASFEQLWLAFVMKDKGKVWNGEDWVKEG